MIVRKNTATVLMAIIVTLGVTLIGTYCIDSRRSTPDITVKIETAFERVTRTRTIRCAYGEWPPYMMVAPNTRQMSGTMYEIMEAVGKVLGYKIEWSENTGFSTFTDNLRSHREDVMCTSIWPSGNRAPYLDFTIAVHYTPAYGYARIDDRRFDGNLVRANNPDVTIAVIDGDYTRAIADADFPKAKQLALPQDSDGSQLLLAVINHKADLAFIDPFLPHEFAKNNPDKIKRVENTGPQRVFGETFPVAKGETALRDMLNVALMELHQNGTIDTILKKYEPAPNAFIRVVPPYDTNTKIN